MEKILEKIYQSSLRFLTPMTMEETYQIIVSEAIKLVNGEIGSILLEDKGVLKRVYTTEPKLNTIEPRPGGFMHTVFITNKPKFLLRKEIIAIHPEIKQTNVHSDIIVPLSYTDLPIGVLTIMSSKNKNFTKKDLTTLKLFGPLATMAIKKTQMYEEMKKTVETRDLFISMASHELKTPLTTINMYIQLMKLKLSSGETFDIHWVNRMSHEIERLTKLVKELLQVEQIKTGDLWYDLKRCSLSEIVSRAIKDFQLIDPDHTIVFNNKIKRATDYVLADYDKLLQVIFNVLNNAAKFSPKYSKITATLQVSNKNITLEIADKGKGISKTDLPNIFQGFYRGANNKHEGMGLGLYLTRQIVERHNGEIIVTSALGKGTKVTISFPSVNS